MSLDEQRMPSHRRFTVIQPDDPKGGAPTVKPSKDQGWTGRRITKEEHAAMLDARRRGWSQREIAELIGCSDSTVLNHIGLSEGDPFMATAGRGERHGQAKLREADVHVIRYLISTGHHDSEIARRYGVSAPCIYAIRNGTNWRHVK